MTQRTTAASLFDVDNTLLDNDRIETLPMRARPWDEGLAKFTKAGIDSDALAVQLQDEGAKAFVESWNELLASIASKGEALQKTS